MQEEALFSAEMQERYPFIQALLHSQDSEFLRDPKNFENMMLDDPETREFILYLQQVQPNLKLPEFLIDGTLDFSLRNNEVDVPSPFSTVRDSPTKIPPASPTSPIKNRSSNYVAITLEDSKEKGHRDEKEDALAALITERAQLNSEKASGEIGESEKNKS